MQDMASSSNESWLLNLKIDVLRAECKARSGNARVFRVPPHIRQLKPRCYDPHIIPMGMYNRDFRKKTYIDQLKLEVLSAFLEYLSVDNKGWDGLCTQLQVAHPGTQVSGAKYLDDFYLDDLTPSLFFTSKLLQLVLIIDAFFIVAMLIWIEQNDKRNPDPPPPIGHIMEIFSRRDVGCNYSVFIHDIFWVYEAQVPLLLVEKVWRKVFDFHEGVDFGDVLNQYLPYFIPNSGLPYREGDETVEYSGCDHLLAFLHRAVCSGTRPVIMTGSESGTDSVMANESGSVMRNESTMDNEFGTGSVMHNESTMDNEPGTGSVMDNESGTGPVMENESGIGPVIMMDIDFATHPLMDNDTVTGRFKSYMHRLLMLAEQMISTMSRGLARYWSTRRGSSTITGTKATLPSASYLRKTGIRFKGVKTNFSGIQFVKSYFHLSATLYLPKMEIDDYTEKKLLNLCAYEYMNSGTTGQGIISFVVFMDQLINAEEDVYLLSHGDDPVIARNSLRDNKKVSKMFTNMLQNFSITAENDELLTVRTEITNWYNELWRRQLTGFLDRFVIAPWLLVSLIAATILLVLTLLQTIYTMRQFNQQF